MCRYEKKAQEERAQKRQDRQDVEDRIGALQTQNNANNTADDKVKVREITSVD